MKLRLNKLFFLFNKKKQNILFFLLILFSVYSSLKIGLSWDESFHINQGKIIFNYLFSFGAINEDFLYRENYSSIYWVLNYFLTTIFPKNIQMEISHLINLAFSLSTVIGISKITKELFNNKVGKISLLILFFFPIFFGHMGFNNKDTILAFSHTWIVYLILRYLKKQHIVEKSKKYIISIALVGATATGIQLVFIGSLFPIFIFLLYEVFFYKKFINKKFSKKKLFYDFLKSFLIFYFFLILFWIDTHENILTLPFIFLNETLSDTYWTGWPYNLVNGKFIFSDNISAFYILKNLFFKSPEFFLLLYLVFCISFFSNNKFYHKEFKQFNYKISFILINLIYPSLILFIMPYPVYDGLRLFLWALPFTCIIPALTIYFLIYNKNSHYKFVSFSVTVLILFYIINFIKLTPYQYTYLNIFAGNKESLNSKFENDYWGGSIKELILTSDLNNEKKILISTCGINSSIAKKYIKQKKISKAQFVTLDKAEFIIMTNRTIHIKPKNKKKDNITTCFKKYPGNDINTVSRNKVILSTIRQVK